MVESAALLVDDILPEAPGPAVGAELSVCASLPVRDSSGGDGPGRGGFTDRDAGLTAGSRVDSREIRGLCFLYSNDGLKTKTVPKQKFTRFLTPPITPNNFLYVA
jgi:hypothetical protein